MKTTLRSWYFPLCLALVLLVGGCAGLETSIAPVTLEMSRGEAFPGQMQEGRRIFSGACTACHSASPVESHTAGQWETIVEWMAPRAKLTQDKKAALLAYLRAASL